MNVPTNYCLNSRCKFDKKDFLRQFLRFTLFTCKLLIVFAKTSIIYFPPSLKPPSYIPGTAELTFLEINVICAQAFRRAFDRKESPVINAEFSVALNDCFLIISRRIQNRTHVIKNNHDLTSRSTRPRNRCEEAVIGEEVMYLETISALFVSGCQATWLIYNNISFFH